MTMTAIRQDHELSERRDLIELKVYVENVLGLKLRLKPWENVKILPYACLLYTSPSPRDS